MKREVNYIEIETSNCCNAPMEHVSNNLGVCRECKEWATIIEEYKISNQPCVIKTKNNTKY